MLHAKFNHRTLDSEEDLKGFYHDIWDFKPSLSCDQNHFLKCMSPLPKEVLHKI